MFRAIAAKEINFALATVSSTILAIARGVPVIAVAELIPSDPFLIWVRSDSRFKGPKDLQGAKMGVPRMGSTSHAFGQAMAKALKFKRGLKFVGAGGLREEMAGLKAGSIDVIIEPLAITIKMKMSGDVRQIGSMTQFLPSQWMDHVILARKDFVERRPKVVGGAVRALLKGIGFMGKNPNWAIERTVSQAGFSREGARLLYEGIKYSQDGRIDRRTMANVRGFLVEFGVIPEAKTPPASALFTGQFTR